MKKYSPILAFLSVLNLSYAQPHPIGQAIEALRNVSLETASDDDLLAAGDVLQGLAEKIADERVDAVQTYVLGFMEQFFAYQSKERPKMIDLIKRAIQDAESDFSASKEEILSQVNRILSFLGEIRNHISPVVSIREDVPPILTDRQRNTKAIIETHTGNLIVTFSKLSNYVTSQKEVDDFERDNQFQELYQVRGGYIGFLKTIITLLQSEKEGDLCSPLWCYPDETNPSPMTLVPRDLYPSLKNDLLNCELQHLGQETLQRNLCQVAGSFAQEQVNFIVKLKDRFESLLKRNAEMSNPEVSGVHDGQLDVSFSGPAKPLSEMKVCDIFETYEMDREDFINTLKFIINNLSYFAGKLSVPSSEMTETFITNFCYPLGSLEAIMTYVLDDWIYDSVNPAIFTKYIEALMCLGSNTQGVCQNLLSESSMFTITTDDSRMFGIQEGLNAAKKEALNGIQRLKAQTEG